MAPNARKAEEAQSSVSTKLHRWSINNCKGRVVTGNALPIGEFFKRNKFPERNWK